MAKSFAADINKFAKVVAKRQRFVFTKSAAALFDTMQTPVKKGGNMPVDTGFLRASFRVTINAPSTDDPGRRVLDQKYKPPAYRAIINRAKPQDAIYGTYLAPYAIYQEYGANGNPPRRFVGLAVAQWPQIVATNVRLAQDIKA